MILQERAELHHLPNRSFLTFHLASPPPSPRSKIEHKSNRIGSNERNVYCEANNDFLFWSRSSVMVSFSSKRKNEKEGQRRVRRSRESRSRKARTNLGSLSLGERDRGLGSLTDDEDVGETGSEGLSEDVCSKRNGEVSDGEGRKTRRGRRNEPVT